MPPFIKVPIASLPLKQAVDADLAPDSAINSTLRLTTPDSATYALPSTDQEKLIDLLFPKKVWQSWKDDSEDPTEQTAGSPTNGVQ